MVLKDLHAKLTPNWRTARAGILTAVSFILLLSGVPVLNVTAGAAVDSILQEKLTDVDRAEKSGNKANLADAFYRVASRYVALSDFKSAEEYLRKSMDVEQTLKRPSQMLDVKTQIATMLLLQHQPDQAIAQYRDAITFAEQSNLLSDVPAIENDISQALRQEGKRQEAEAELKAAVEKCKNRQSSDAEVAYRNLAAMYAQQGRTKEALACAKEAADLLTKYGDQGKAGNAICDAAELQDTLGNSDEALKTLKDLLGWDSLIFSDVIIRAEIAWGKSLARKGQVPAAIEHFKKAVEIAQEDGKLQDLLLQASTELGSCYADQEKFDLAEKAHKQALDQARAAHLDDRELEASLQLAEDYLMEGASEKALGVLRSATAVANRNANVAKYTGDINVEMAKCYKQLGQKDPAVHLIEEAIKIYRSADNTVSEALATNALATIYLDFGDLEKLAALQNRADKLYGSITDPTERARFDYNKAQGLLMRDKAGEAIPIFEQALNSVSSTHDSGLQSGLYRGLATAYYLTGDYQKSLDNYEKALDLTKDSGSLDARWSCNLGVGKALKGLGRYNDAEKYLVNAAELVEQERSHLTRDSFKTHNLDFRRDCFFELVDLYVLENKPYEALTVAERGKARAFLDMLSNRNDRRIETLSYGNAGSTLTAPKPQGAPVMVAMAPGAAGERSVTITGHQDLRDEAIDETAISPINATPPSIDEIKNLVSKRGSTCVEYLCLHDKIYAWVIQPDGSVQVGKILGKTHDVVSDVSELAHGITQTAKTPAEVQVLNAARQVKLQKLYALLVKPIEQWLPKDKEAVVTIVPHDVLFSVPFAALVDNNNKFFIENHTLSYLPALGVMRATQKLDEEASAAPHKLLGFGNPIIKRIAFLGQLPYAEKEVKHIAQLYPQGSSTLEIGEQATKKAFADMVPNYTDIHLATHGLVDEERPMRSSLVLAPASDDDDGLLSVKDIITLKGLKARLVTLSACETAKGKITGDGVVGLSRAFIIAGAPSVLVSQWNVDDVMTEYQMSRFYAAYLKGKDKAHALRDAQLATIAFMEDGVEPGKPRANPRYWAAFQLIGENK